MSPRTTQSQTAAKPEVSTARRPEPKTPSRETAPNAGRALLELQTGPGNRATTGLLQTGILQPSLRIGPLDDCYEREADRMADRVMAGESGDALASGSPATASVQRLCPRCDEELKREPAPTLDAVSEARVQRVCSECEQELEEEEEEEPLQREPSGPWNGNNAGTGARATQALESRLASLQGRGSPLSPTQRGFFEPRFGQDLSAVRLHTGPAASEAARLARARAFTVGRDVVFGAGEHRPETRSGQKLMAHELTHVVQQTPLTARRKPVLQRQPVAAEEPAPEPATAPQTEPAAPETGAPGPETESDAEAAREVQAPGLLVEDDATDLEPGQMTRTEFLAATRAAVCTAADTEFEGTEFTAQSCPYVELVLHYYESLSAERIEQDLVTYLPAAAGAASASAYTPLIADRVRQSAETFVSTGEVTGIPEGVPSSLISLVESATDAIGIFFKARAGGARGSADPHAVRARLGSGRSLAGSVGSRMRSAFGRSFSRVRVHTDAMASSLSRRFNARAFTVGDHVAFGSGEYRPGTPVGDALVAHELAHVEQQRRAGDSLAPMRPGAGATTALERDADRSAAGVVASLWRDANGSASKIARHAVPRLRSGLSLQRCTGKKVEGEPGMGLTAKPSVKSESYSFNEYVELWEKAADRSMTDEEKETLAKGCVGITLLNLGGSRKMHSECYDQFDQAKKRKKELEKETGESQYIFSKRFWAMGQSFAPDKTTGKVDMSGHKNEKPPGEVNFDYGWYDEVNDTWWHANHCDPVERGSGCSYDKSERMKVYQSTLEHFSDPTYFGADVQVFCVAWSALK
ncbi:MAG: DUF4157 domain-containing protein [Thermoanaerobaculia bacterium]